MLFTLLLYLPLVAFVGSTGLFGFIVLYIAPFAFVVYSYTEFIVFLLTSCFYLVYNTFPFLVCFLCR